jgi:hypothetical protein
MLKTAVKCLVSFLVFVGLAVAGFRLIAFRQAVRIEPQFTLSRPPLPPLQPITIELKCTRGLVLRMSEIGGDWSLTSDHPPCTVGENLLPPVEATVAEFVSLERRPFIMFRVAAKGSISDAMMLRSSGSRTLDEKSLKLALAHRFPRHNCGLCKVSTDVDVNFQGPVWVRESTN